MKITIEANVNEAKELVGALGNDITIQLKQSEKKHCFYHGEFTEEKCPVCKASLVPIHKRKYRKHRKPRSQEACVKISKALKKAHKNNPVWRRKNRGKAYVQEEYDGELDIRVPHKIKKGIKKSLHARKSPEHLRHWLTVDRLKVEQFYSNPDNHYSSGEMIHTKLVEFAKTIDRTPMAVSVQIIAMGLNKKMVRGIIARNLHKEFPEFKTVKHIPDDLLKTIFKQLAQGKRASSRTLTLEEAFAFGIEDAKHWAMFLQEVMMKANQIALNLRIKNRFKITGQGAQMTLVYE